VERGVTPRRINAVTRVSLAFLSRQQIANSRALPSFRITAKDRPKIDPFTIQDTESIIAAAHRMHGEWYGVRQL
jgi:hypothetical protein